MAEVNGIDRPDLVEELDLTLDEVQTLVSIKAEDTFAPGYEDTPAPPQIPDLPRRATIFSRELGAPTPSSAGMQSLASSHGSLPPTEVDLEAAASGTVIAGREHGFSTVAESTPSDGTPLGPDVAEAIRVGQADFVLEELIARGGQGEVWRARQPSLDRDIALKILPVDRSDRAVIGFLQEAYTSAALDHPYIAPVHELGSSTVEGHTFHMLAMKLVRGSPWHEQMRAHRREADFDLEVHLARHLPIFLDLCHAVAYAHSKHIIHRDLKPRQVVIGDFGEVYLLDWGLAISLVDEVPPVAGRNLPKFRTRGTATNRSGTPAYMAPEQTERSTAALGYHTDIYLLGGVLYEIVCGRPPHRADTATAAFRRARNNEYDPLPPLCPAELRCVIESALATTPASRPGGVHELRRSVEEFLSGAGRQRESRTLEQEARASFETLTGRPDYSAFVDIDKKLDLALARWPSNTGAAELREATRQRYAAAALDAGDLQLARSLALEFHDDAARARIQARTAEAAERLHSHEAQRAMLRRVIAGMMLAAALGILSLVALFLLRREADARAREQADLAALFRSATSLNAEERQLAEELSTAIPFPETVLPTSDRESTTSLDRQTIGTMVIVRDVRRRRGEMEQNEAMKGLLPPPPREIVLGEANLAMNRAVTAAEALQAYELYSEVHAARDDLIQPITGMGISAARAGFPTSATIHLAEATRRTVERFGAKSAQAATALALQGEASRLLNEDTADYRKYYRESLEILEPQWTALSLTLAERARGLGEYETALRYSSPTLAVVGDTPSTEGQRVAEAARVVGASLSLLGRHTEAEPLLRGALARTDASFPADSPERLPLFDDLAASLEGQERFGEAEATLREAHAVSLRIYGEHHPMTARVLHRVAHVVHAQGRFEEARVLYGRVLAERRRLLGDEHPDTADSLISSGVNLAALGRDDDAERHFREALDARIAIFGERHSDTAAAMGHIARQQQARGGTAAAEELYRTALAICRETLPPTHDTTLRATEDLAACLMLQDRQAEAIALRLDVLNARRAARGEGHRDVAAALLPLADSLAVAGRSREARLLCLRAIATSRRALGDGHPATIGAAMALFSRCLPEIDSGDRTVLGDVMTLGCWLDAVLRAAPHTTRRDLEERWLPVAQGLTSAALKLSPPNTEAATRWIRRLAALARVLELPADSSWRRDVIVPIVARLQLPPDAAVAPPPPQTLWPDRNVPMETAALLSYLDSVAVPLAAAAAFGDVGCSPDDLLPSGDALDAEFAATRDALDAEFGSTTEDDTPAHDPAADNP